MDPTLAIVADLRVETPFSEPNDEIVLDILEGRARP
jgi:hypothetical protein